MVRVMNDWRRDRKRGASGTFRQVHTHIDVKIAWKSIPARDKPFARNSFLCDERKLYVTSLFANGTVVVCVRDEVINLKFRTIRNKEFCVRKCLTTTLYRAAHVHLTFRILPLRFSYSPHSWMQCPSRYTIFTPVLFYSDVFLLLHVFAEYFIYLCSSYVIFNVNDSDTYDREWN